MDFFGHGFEFLRDDAGRTVLLDRLEPGGGVPLHVHLDLDEVFYVLEGEFRFGLADETFTARPGDFLFAAKGTPHGFRCVGESAGCFLNVCTPGGFREFVEAALELHRSGTAGPEDFAELGRRFKTEFVGGMPE